jgi:hypothetical protein
MAPPNPKMRSPATLAGGSPTVASEIHAEGAEGRV